MRTELGQLELRSRVLLGGILLLALSVVPAEAIMVPGAEKNASYQSIELDRQELERQNNAYSLDRLDLGEITGVSSDPIPLTLKIRVEVDYLFEARGLWKRWTEGADPIAPRKQELAEALRGIFLPRYSALRLCSEYRDGHLKAELLKTLSTLPKLDENEDTQTLYAAHIPGIGVFDAVTQRELTFAELEKHPGGWGAPPAVVVASEGAELIADARGGLEKVQEKSGKKPDKSGRKGAGKAGKNKAAGKSAKAATSSKKPKPGKPAKPGKTGKPGKRSKKPRK